VALDLFGIVSNGVYPEDRTGDDDWFGYAVSMGLFTSFPAATLLLLALGLGRHGFCLTMD
jgi:hypothetical protein